MVFSDLEFLPFFLVVLGAIVLNHYTWKSLRLQNLIYLAGSYYFYAQWDWRFLSLLIISTILDFIVGWQVEHDPRNRKRWLALSITGNLGILGFFKYYNFFVTEAVAGLESLGIHASPSTLNVILPVGISFYTFQTMTYALDVYRGQMKASRSLLEFATYVAFFPQLVAGPIERASHLLPQFHRPWRFDEQQVTQGLRLILFGLAMKVCVADKLAPIVDEIFSNPGTYNGGTLVLGSVYFAFQIYGDFCGYSTIAIGIAKILGFQLMTNFATPYFATSPQDFWRRWHISLSTFFRDYLYIPLGGNRRGEARRQANLFLTMLLGGLWHGAGWTFVIWGGLHGVYLAVNHAWRALPSSAPRTTSQATTLASGLLTFVAVVVAWVFFRAPNVSTALEMLRAMAGGNGVGDLHLLATADIAVVVALLALAWLAPNTQELTAYEGPHGAYDAHARPGVKTTSGFAWTPSPRWALATGVLLAVSVMSLSRVSEFLYFQF